MDEQREPLWKRYEMKALDALDLSQQYVGGHVEGAKAYAAQAQAYATLAQMHRPFNE